MNLDLQHFQQVQGYTVMEAITILVLEVTFGHQNPQDLTCDALSMMLLLSNPLLSSRIWVLVSVA